MATKAGTSQQRAKHLSLPVLGEQAERLSRRPSLRGAKHRAPPGISCDMLEATFQVERETTFFIPLEVLSEFVNLAALPVSEIVQHYFPKRSLEYVKSFALAFIAERGQHALHESVCNCKFKSARLRTILSNKIKRYFLELKSRKSGPDRSRAELSIPIDEAKYLHLLTYANEGALQKFRHHLAGQIHSEPARGIRVYAEIDTITGAGMPQGSERAPPRSDVTADFALVDIEFPAEEHADLAEKHFHTFPFLAVHGVNLTRAAPSLRKPLSARVLAREGFTKQTKAASAALKKLSLQSGLARVSATES